MIPPIIPKSYQKWISSIQNRGRYYIIWGGVYMCLQFGKWHSLAVIPSLFLVLCPLFLQFLRPSWFSSVLFFPPSTVPILPKNIPKQETNNKNTFEISHPPKIPNKNKPKKKPAPFLWHSWSKIGWTSSTTPAAQTLEGVEGDLAWIAGKNYGNIIYRWRFYLWF